MKHRRSIISDAELAEIEADLDELEALVRKPRRRRGIPAAGGGTFRPKARTDALRPRPAAFARAIALNGLKPIAAAFQAGYRAPNRQTCWRLLRDVKVRAEIERLSDASRNHG